jgi:hypothetical protein
VTGRGLVKHLADGETLDLPGWSMTMKVGPADTAGGLTVISGRLQPGHEGFSPGKGRTA